jgi:hypothetical protein
MRPPFAPLSVLAPSDLAAILRSRSHTISRLCCANAARAHLAVFMSSRGAIRGAKRRRSPSSSTTLDFSRRLSALVEGRVDASQATSNLYFCSSPTGLLECGVTWARDPRLTVTRPHDSSSFTARCAVAAETPNFSARVRPVGNVSPLAISPSRICRRSIAAIFS